MQGQHFHIRPSSLIVLFLITLITISSLFVKLVTKVQVVSVKRAWLLKWPRQLVCQRHIMACKNKNWSLWNVGCYLYAFDVIKKVSTVSVCNAFQLDKKKLNFFSWDYTLLHPSVSDFKWLTVYFIFWLWWSIYESWDLT